MAFVRDEIYSVGRRPEMKKLAYLDLKLLKPIYKCFALLDIKAFLLGTPLNQFFILRGSL